MIYFLIIYLSFCPVCKLDYRQAVKKEKITEKSHVAFITCTDCGKLNSGTVFRITEYNNEIPKIIYEKEN